jgi:anti-sigma B factor antagonist
MSDEFGIVEGGVRGNTVLLRVRGRLDARSAPVLLKAASDVRRARQNLVLNLSEVTFMASSGLGSLLSLAEEFRQSENRIRIAEASTAVLSVVQLLNLDQFLKIDSSEEEALVAIHA